MQRDDATSSLETFKKHTFQLLKVTSLREKIFGSQLIYPRHLAHPSKMPQPRQLKHREPDRHFGPISAAFPTNISSPMRAQIQNSRGTRLWSPRGGPDKNFTRNFARHNSRGFQVKVAKWGIHLWRWAVENIGKGLAWFLQSYVNFCTRSSVNRSWRSS